MLLQHMPAFVKNKTGKSCAATLIQKHTPKINAQSYIYIMQIIRSLSFSGSEIYWFRLPIIGIMYSGLRQIAALRPTSEPTYCTRTDIPVKVV